MEDEDAFTLPPLLVTDAVIQGITSGAVSKSCVGVYSGGSVRVVALKSEHCSR